MSCPQSDAPSAVTSTGFAPTNADTNQLGELISLLKQSLRRQDDPAMQLETLQTLLQSQPARMAAPMTPRTQRRENLFRRKAGHGAVYEAMLNKLGTMLPMMQDQPLRADYVRNCMGGIFFFFENPTPDCICLTGFADGKTFFLITPPSPEQTPRSLILSFLTKV